MKNLALVAVGDYNDILANNIELIEKLDDKIDCVYILTDNIEFLQQRTKGTKHTYFFNEYVRKEFNYFDKLYYTLNVYFNTNVNTLYCDVGMLSRLDDYDLNNNKPGIVYPREWGVNSKNANLLRGFGCDAFEEGYWDEFVVHIEKSGIRPEEVATIFEQTLLINSDPNLFSVYEHLKSIENLFVKYSTSKYNKYKFVGNGEGLALAFACIKAGVNISKFRYIKSI